MTSQVHVNHSLWGFARFALRRMSALAGAWALLGALMGLNCEALWRGDTISVAANVVAWSIVMGITGAIMSAFGGRPLSCWVGAAGGFLIAVIAGIRMPELGSSIQMQLNFGALVGAIVAATCWPWIRLTIAVAQRVRTLLASAQ